MGHGQKNANRARGIADNARKVQSLGHTMDGMARVVRQLNNDFNKLTPTVEEATAALVALGERMDIVEYKLEPWYRRTWWRLCDWWEDTVVHGCRALRDSHRVYLMDMEEVDGAEVQELRREDRVGGDQGRQEDAGGRGGGRDLVPEAGGDRGADVAGVPAVAGGQGTGADGSAGNGANKPLRDVPTGDDMEEGVTP